MKHLHFFICLLIINNIYSQGVAINTDGTPPNPSAMLHVDVGSSTTKGFLVTGSANSGTVPSFLPGSRLMFFPGKSAFRVGHTITTEWDDFNVGQYSMAMGYGPRAVGNTSTALGYFTFARADYSTAIGNQADARGVSSMALGYQTVAGADYATAIGNSSFAFGLNSTAIGYKTSASGDYCTAMGLNTSASGYCSLAMGYNSVADNDYATTMGFVTTASGFGSTAMGVHTKAIGDYSVALGSSVEASRIGSFFFGDSDPHFKGARGINTNDQIAMRFNGGYYFITDNSGATDKGVFMGPGDNSWSAISDVRLKENFIPVNGEDFLQKISKMPLTTWNYKDQDVKTFRHYGPMAQDFYAAFGHDKLGTIGCDTLINQQDFLGVNLIAIQALEKRTQKTNLLEKTIDEQNHKIDMLLKRIEVLEKK
jgi:hypothetical protein